MQALKITFALNGPIALPDRPLHLDALLAYIYTQSRMFMLEPPYSREDLLALADDLPLARYEKDGDWVYKASALQPVGPMNHTSIFTTARHSCSDIAHNMNNKTVVNKRDKLPHPHMSHKGLVDLGRGHVRNSLLYHNVTYVEQMEAYCIGDKEALIDDFSKGYITHLGKMRRMGLGYIQSISVEDDESAKIHWKLRVKHFKETGDAATTSPLRPPYWLKENENLHLYLSI